MKFLLASLSLLFCFPLLAREVCTCDCFSLHVKFNGRPLRYRTPTNGGNVISNERGQLSSNDRILRAQFIPSAKYGWGGPNQYTYAYRYAGTAEECSEFSDDWMDYRGSDRYLMPVSRPRYACEGYLETELFQGRATFTTQGFLAGCSMRDEYRDRITLTYPTRP